MGWKKALFFGGAVLVLAACSDSTTAPGTLRQSNTAAAVKTKSDSTSTSTSTVLPGLPIIDPICTGIVIRTGVDTDSTSTATCSTTQ